jgi:hypothetical protein
MAQVDYTVDRTAAAQDAWTFPAQVSDPVLYSSEWAARITAKYFGKPVLDELLALIYSRVASKTYAKLWTCLAALNVGDPVYISAIDTVTLALATTEPTSRVVGFVRSKPSTITCYIEHYLLKTGLSGLTAGDPVYLTDAGAFGAAAGTVSKTIGYAIDTDEALLSASPAPGGGAGDHGALSGLADDDHTQYLLASGTRALSAAWDAGSWQIRAETFQSDVATGTPPLTVASTTAVTNLNADLLDGNHAAAFALAGAAPTAHAASHVTGGADIIAVATTSAVGLTPAATAPGAGLLSVLAIANGETVRTDKAIFDTTNPEALGVAAPGTQVIAARRDHVHAAPASLHTQNTDTGTTGAEFTIDSDAIGGKITIQAIEGPANKRLILANAALTDDRTITFPDATGTVALTGAAPTAHAASHVTGGGDVIANAIAAGNSGLMSGADKTKLDGIETAADVTDATNVAAAGAVMESDYTAADVVLVGTGVGTTGAVTLAASQFLGKKAAGAATNLTATEARTILNVADGANAYVHPNHSGDVTSAADGAQTIGAKKVTVAMLADGTAGQLVTWDAAGVAATVAAGTATHVLTSNGAGAAPTFQAAPGGGGFREALLARSMII